MKNLHVFIMEMVCQYYGVSIDEAIMQPSIHRNVDLSDANKAFALVCWFYGRQEMYDLRMDARQIARYFGIIESQAVKATYRDQYLHYDPYYRLVKDKVLIVVNTHLNQLYEREQV